MKIFTPNEANNWLEARDIKIIHNSPSFGIDWKTCKLDWLKDSIQAAEFCRETVRLFLGDNMLIWIIEWGVFNNEESFLSMYYIRKAWGEGRSLEEAPAFVFGADETKEASSLLYLLIRFEWDAYIVAGNARNALNLHGHEKHIERYVKTYADDVGGFWTQG